MFPITMSFTVSTEAELARLVAAAAKTPATAGAPQQEVKKADPKPEATAAASAAPPAATTATPAPTAAASGDKTVDDAKALTIKIVADKGRDAAVALLKKFNVPVAAKLPAEQIADFCSQAEAVLTS